MTLNLIILITAVIGSVPWLVFNPGDMLGYMACLAFSLAVIAINGRKQS